MANERVNIYLGASAMRTSLGNKTETLAAMCCGECGLRYEAMFGMYAGLASVTPIEGYSRFESIAIEQIEAVVRESGISISSDDVQLVISTTKGNVDLLAEDCDNISERAFIYSSAQAIVRYFGCANRPVVISNACISGVSAFVVAKELLQTGRCRHAVVVGGDVLSEFITSGFASFKSISSQPCRPYDAERDGLTLGEAAGAILLTIDPEFAAEDRMRLVGGAISNDANHISGPSRTGDGLYYAIRDAMCEAGIDGEDVAFVNTHGTATRYNDEMESRAVAWAGLDHKPLNSLKGYIGHTLGGSGVVETIVAAEQLRAGYIFGTRGFHSSDTPHQLCLSAEAQSFSASSCVKTASGFGGCNAAIVLSKAAVRMDMEAGDRASSVVAEYELAASECDFAEYIREEFKRFGHSDMKFYKMSDMSKALYVAVEHLLLDEGFGDIEPTRRAIVLGNRSASLDADAKHQAIINQHLAEGASPAVFVYTLANVAAGEMCIRHKIQGDNTFFIEDEDSGLVEWYARRLVANNRADAVICGWCDYLKGEWDVRVKLLKHN